MKWVKRGVFIAIGLAVLAAAVYGFLPKPVAVETAKVTRGDMQMTVDQEARTRVRDRYTIYAPLAASVQRITLKAGDAVKTGQVLVTIAPLPPAPLDARAKAEAQSRIQAAEQREKSASSAVDAAEAEYVNAKSEHDRLMKLPKGQLVSQEVVDATRNAAAAAAARLESAKFNKQAAMHELELARAALVSGNEGADLTAIEIKSPVDGRVLRVHRESAGTVAPGEPLIEVGDPAAIEVVADLLSRDAARVRAGMSVRLERWGGEDALKGKVRVVESSGFTKISALGVEEQRVNVLIDITDPYEKWQALGDGYRVEARVILSERVSTLKAPAGAVFNTSEGAALFKAVEGKAARTLVKTGVRTGLEVEIVSGASEADVVIVHPGDNVADGTPITQQN
jgi:HlyD family secretion protein